jgi:hypothetical protein
MQMHALSARIPAEDMQWLMGLNLQGAVTPSDKLRALISQMRRQFEGTLDYDLSVSWLRDLIAPFVVAIRALENHNKIHSEVVTLVAEWLPQVMAVMLSERSLAKDEKARAVELEDVLVRRCFQMLTSMLRLAVTREAGCYNPQVVEAHVPAVLEIANVISQIRKNRESASE